MNTDTPNLSYLLNQSDVLLCLVDSNFRVTYLSPAWQAQLSKQDKSIIGCGFDQLVHESDREDAVQAVERAFKFNGSDLKLNFRHVGDDSFVRFKCLGKMIGQSDAPLLLLGAIEDTAPASLKSNDVNLSLFIDATSETSKVGYWQFNAKTQKLTWSDEIYQIHGLKNDQYSPELESSLQFYHADDVAEARRCLQEALTCGKDWHCNIRIKQVGGNFRTILSRGTVHLDELGNTDSIFGIYQDLTEHQHLKQELDMLSVAVKATTVGIAITDSNRQVLWINDAFAALTGYSYSEVAGHNLSTFLQGEDTDSETIQRIKDGLAAEKSVNEKILNYHKSGKTYWNHLIITPIYQQSELTHFVGIQHNITAEVESKTALKELNNSLEKLVKERTLALENANRELRHLANKDPLTGAFNRRAYYEQMDIEIKRSSRLKQPLSIALIDIDFFKMINDKYGHSAGDNVLVSLVRLITSQKRELDFLFRMGGEEFLLLMPCTNNSEAMLVAERIRRKIADLKIDYDNTQLVITVSIGLITECCPRFDDNYLKKVDKYLYRAKANRRNQVVAFKA